MDYRRIKEDFVSNLNGTTVADVALVVSSAPLAVLCRDVLILALITRYGPRFKFLLDFSVLILPVLLSFTVLADHLPVFLGSLGTTALSLSLWHVYQSTHTPTTTSRRAANKTWSKLWSSILATPTEGKRPFITNFRAYVNIATAIAILAVDFTIFPRRFGKAETYGTGLMDAGVGAFVISNGIVSPEARGKHPAERSVSDRLMSILRSVKSTFPLLVIGLLRLLAVKSTDYQEHVSEYGIHWNFFFTLAAVKILSTAVLCVASPSVSWLLAVLIGVGYQYLLTGLHLRDFVLEGSDGRGSRHGFLNANREGIVSCLGYLAIYFAGVQLGKFIFRPRRNLKDWLTALLVLVVANAVFWLLLFLCETQIEVVSRRMANLAYILWMMGYNLQLVASFLLVDVLCVILQNYKQPSSETGAHQKRKGDPVKKYPMFCLLSAVNRNGLLYFLLANLLTGCVNFSMATVYVQPITAFMVVKWYMFVLCAIAAILDVKQLTVKFW